MRRSGVLAALLVGIMLFMMPCASFASASDDAVSLFYLYTKKASASLSINDSGRATCSGLIRAEGQSDISLTLTLYRKSGSAWIKVTSWTETVSDVSLTASRTYTVTQGTYKVVLSGKVTTANGETEQISKTSLEVTYPAQ